MNVSYEDDKTCVRYWLKRSEQTKPGSPFEVASSLMGAYNEGVRDGRAQTLEKLAAKGAISAMDLLETSK